LKSRPASDPQPGARGERRDGPFINAPERTLRPVRFGGVEVTSGRGQILRPIFFFYRASTLLPFRAIAIEWAWLLIYTAILPVAWLALRARRGWLHRHRRGRGLCPACGYDLRGTPDRCPGCGAEAKPQPAEGAAA
jgi:hypothetical protein